MTKNRLKGIAMLTLCAMIWGSAFVAQSTAMDHVQPFTFQATRSFLGALVLLPWILVRRKKKMATKSDPKLFWKVGLSCGVTLCIACCLQQFGVYYNDLAAELAGTATDGAVVGKAGFVTALYILLVPLFGLFFKKKVGGNVWVGVGLALFGLYLLCMTGKTVPDFGDILVFGSAIFFAIQILIVDSYIDRVDGVELSCFQFFVVGVLSAVAMFMFETPSVSAICDAWVEILYAGAMSSGIAYTLQILGQKYTPPTLASMLMSLESVFAVLAAALLLGQIPTWIQVGGCVLMFAAIVLAQLPEKKKEN